MRYLVNHGIKRLKRSPLYTIWFTRYLGISSRFKVLKIQLWWYNFSQPCIQGAMVHLCLWQLQILSAPWLRAAALEQLSASVNQRGTLKSSILIWFSMKATIYFGVPLCKPPVFFAVDCSEWLLLWMILEFLELRHQMVFLEMVPVMPSFPGDVPWITSGSPWSQGWWWLLMSQIAPSVSVETSSN